MQIGQCLNRAAEQLNDLGVSDSARLDAEVLLGSVIGKSRSYLFAYSEQNLQEAELLTFEQLLQRRIKGEPIAYIIGCREFWSLPFKVSPHVLIPRPDTEVLVERILALDLPNNSNVIDLGTGSGAIAVALASERAGWHCLGVDTSLAALQVADDNKNNLLNTDNCSLLCANWLSAVAANSVQLVVSNPPYICSDDSHLQEGDVRFEPSTALVSGEDGLDDIRCICDEAYEVLAPGGCLIVEHGWHQQQQVVELFSDRGYIDVETGRDLAGQPRFVLARCDK